jgi:polyhydroxybutyrate depolymerase
LIALLNLLCLAALTSNGAWGQPADTEQTFPFQGVDRRFVLHRPANRTGPVPVVVALHGLGESVADLRDTWTMDAVADREGFAVLYPMALADRWSYVAARAVRLPDGSGTVDDVGFILGLLDRLATDHTIDPARVYVAGVSNGGLMAWTLACQAPDRFADIAPLITGMVEQQLQQCHPARLVPLLAIAGTDDWVQAYDGAMGPNYRLMSMPETLEFWRKQRGCTGLNLTTAPSHGVRDPTRAVLVSWTGCTDPSPQRFWRIEGGGHSLPSMAPLSDRERARGPHGGRSQAIETAEEVWMFFAASGP